MPSKQLKRNFFAGKQDRDSENRIVGNTKGRQGEYRKLVNGRVSRSEGSDVGAIENLLGNESLSTFIDQTATVIGSIRDQQDNRVFYFIVGATEDGIYEYSEITDSVRIILRSSKSGVLNFSVGNLITGVNLIGDGDEKLLLWTDGLNAPRRVNIERMFTRHSERLDGVVIADDGTRTAGFTEEEISVVKMPPLNPPNISITQVDDLNSTTDDELETLREQNFRDKFVRFAYRWKFVDDEYSVFSPFSETVFSVGQFSFDRITGEITSMDNLVRAVDISFNTGSRDVTEIELLYKVSDSPTVYVVENYVKEDPTLNWGNNIDLSPLNENETPVEFSSNKLYRALPDRELARVFDNVPITAKAQEIIENRIVYGNYTDRYDINDVLKTFSIVDGERVQTGEVRSPITIDLTAQIADDELRANSEDVIPGIIGDFGEKNLKSDTDYEVGIVYEDNVGRKTPVLTSTNNTVHIPIQRANRRNRLKVSINHKSPDFATSYKIYIKNTKGVRHNIIPINYYTDPSNNELAWFRISTPDEPKVSVGDFLNIKISDHQFSYRTDTQQKIQVRVDEIGVQEENFLESDPQRIGRTYDSNGNEEDPGTIIVLQEAGVWMKVRNIPQFGDQNKSSAETSRTEARTNNARDLKNRPITGTIEDYQDETNYYPGSIITNTETDIGSVTFGGTYTTGTGLNTGVPAGFTVPNGDDVFGPANNVTNHGGAGPMRVEVIIAANNTYQVAYYLSPSFEEPRVTRRLVNGTGTAIPANTTPVQLFNGVTIAFNEVPGNYNVGDKFTVVYRYASNFMWRCWDITEEDTAGGPNGTNRRGFDARRAHIMVPGPDITELYENGINGNSMIQFGIQDGRGGDNGGQPPITVPFENNEYFTDNVFYSNLEEWMFESERWDSGISGTDRVGNGFGIHQCGFWRGMAVPPGEAFSLDDVLRIAGFATGFLFLVSLFAGEKNVDNNFRIASGSSNAILGGERTDANIYSSPTEDSVPLPLFMMVQSGVRNGEGRFQNRKKADIRMGADFNFVQGRGVDEDNLMTVGFCFETVGTDNFNQPFFEIGDNFKCENGVHYGNDPNDTQLVNNIAPDGEGTETSTVTKPVVINLDYFNCIAFRNGIESMSIGDRADGASIDQGVKASIVVDNYEREENTADLIYSQSFNDTTGVNGLGDFSSADSATGAIIKQMDNADGSIQHLYSENTDLIVFQEDKVNVVQVDKSALFNADGSTNVVGVNRFLNQTIPTQGEYGISLNPESFSVYGNTKYFSDKNRGSMLQLEGRSVTEISDFGMRDFFRENLDQNDVVLGSYDDFHDQYVVTMRPFFTDPSLEQENLPLLLSRQGFLSRNDACRFPENKLQFTEVYEFWQENEPAGFQVGDIIYNDIAKTSIFNGDDDWFVWNVEEEVQVVSTGIAGDTGLFTYRNDATAETLMVDQVIVLQSNATTTEYPAIITEIGSSGVRVRFTGAGATLPSGSELITGVNFDLEVTFKFVINIDNFGMVRRKLDCIGIPRLNHDAFRASIEGYGSPQEACGNGVVSRILYHNGNDATPDRGDSIFDTPYGDDEYVEVFQTWKATIVDANNNPLPLPYDRFDRVVHDDADGIPRVWEAVIDNAGGIEPTVANVANWTLTTALAEYRQGRTQRRGWYQIFDGSDFEDYVIRILEGRVVEKIRCASIRAGRNSVTIGSQIARNTGENDNQFAARICRTIPGNLSYHNGSSRLPIAGNRMFINDHTDATLEAGNYSIEGGNYIIVNDNGDINQIVPCVVRVCVRDLINTYGSNDGILNNQFVNVVGAPTATSNLGSFTYNGIENEEIYGNEDKQDAAQVTIRWSARGSERHPSNPNDFYEQTFQGLSPGDTVNLTNASFLASALGETDLEYSILEFCHNQTLVPQFVSVRYYNDDNPAVPDYPSINPATFIATIFDNTGNLGTGLIEVNDEIYFDRTAVIERYFTDDALVTPLDGTNGVTNNALLDSIVIDGVTRRGLWWAFGDTDNAAALEGLLIDSNGFVINRRGRVHPFLIQLIYHVDNEVIACTAVDSAFSSYLSDNDDFEDTTTFVNLDGSVPAEGYYVWDNNNDTPLVLTDDQRLVRYWDGVSAFEAGRFNDATATVDNCASGLPSVSRRYSTNEQTLVCSSAPFATYFLEGGATLAILAAETGTIGIFTNQFGRRSIPASAVPAGFFQETIAGTTINYTWTGTRVNVNNVPCVIICTDTDADNTNSAGDCRYPTYCSNSTATNFNQLQDGTATSAAQRAKFNSSTAAPVCTFPAPPATYEVDITIINNIQGTASGYTIAPGTGWDANFDRTYLTTASFDTADAVILTVAEGHEFTTASAVTYSRSTGTGTGGQTIAVTSTLSGTVAMIATAPVGCNIASAANYIQASNGLGTCYYGGTDYLVSTSDILACDSFNSGSSNRSTFYNTVAGAPETVGTILYTLSGGVYTQSTTTGWLTRNGNSVFRVSNGSITESNVTCPAYPRISSLGFRSTTTQITAGSEFSFQVSWVGAAAGQLYYVVVSSSETIGTEEGDVGEATSFRGTVFHRPSSDSSFRLTATVYFGTNASGAVAGTVNSDRIEVESTIGGGGAF